MIEQTLLYTYINKKPSKVTEGDKSSKSLNGSKRIR